METKVSMIIMSHLSDIQEGDYSMGENNVEYLRNERINFIKWLVLKYPDTRVEIDPNAEYAEFEKNRKG